MWVFQTDDKCIETLSSLVAKSRGVALVGDDNNVAIELHLHGRTEEQKRRPQPEVVDVAQHGFDGVWVVVVKCDLFLVCLLSHIYQLEVLESM